MITFAEAPWWGSGLFTLGAVILTWGFTFQIQRFIHKATRVKERYAKLRNAYATFAATGMMYAYVQEEAASVAVRIADTKAALDKVGGDPAFTDRRNELSRQLERHHTHKDDSFIKMSEHWSRLNANALDILAIEHNLKRRSQVQIQNDALNNAVSRNDLRNLTMDTAARQAAESTKAWVLRVFTQLEEEENIAYKERWLED
ncbi:MAG: hypothetical protein WC718_16970 [Phycisphaerales bacterium]|jgi:hypothetical protein